jgi:hypothetical protein
MDMTNKFIESRTKITQEHKSFHPPNKTKNSFQDVFKPFAYIPNSKLFDVKCCGDYGIDRKKNICPGKQRSYVQKYPKITSFNNLTNESLSGANNSFDFPNIDINKDCCSEKKYIDERTSTLTCNKNCVFDLTK